MSKTKTKTKTKDDADPSNLLEIAEQVTPTEVTPTNTAEQPTNNKETIAEQKETETAVGEKEEKKKTTKKASKRKKKDKKQVSEEEKRKNRFVELLTSINGVGRTTAERLWENGFNTIDVIMNTRLDQFLIYDIDPITVKKIKTHFANEYPEFSQYLEKEEHSLLEIPSIGKNTAKKMIEKGIDYFKLVAMPPKELSEKLKMSEDVIKNYKTSVQRSQTIFMTASEIFEQLKNSKTFTTGVEALDELLEIEINTGDEKKKINGIRLGDTYEFYGMFKSGKSQISHQLCVTIQLPPEYGGLGKKAVYIDTENTFTPSRIISIYKHLKKKIEEQGGKWELTEKQVLDNILVAKALSVTTQINAVKELFDLFSKERNKYGVVVIDSVTAHFRSEYAGRGTLSERQQQLNSHLADLTRIATTFNVAVIVTNQVQANPGQMFGDPTTHVGGNIMGHWAKTRIYLRKSSKNTRVAKVMDSPELAEKEAIFEITENGIEDVKR